MMPVAASSGHRHCRRRFTSAAWASRRTRSCPPFAAFRRPSLLNPVPCWGPPGASLKAQVSANSRIYQSPERRLNLAATPPISGKSDGVVCRYEEGMAETVAVPEILSPELVLIDPRSTCDEHLRHAHLAPPRPPHPRSCHGSRSPATTPAVALCGKYDARIRPARPRATGCGEGRLSFGRRASSTVTADGARDVAIRSTEAGSRA
jgi:hypothetical protein